MQYKDNQGGRRYQTSGIGGHPLLMQMCQQDGFFDDAKKIIQRSCANLADFEAKYWQLVGIWDAIHNANVMDRDNGEASYPIELIDQVTALRRDLMIEMIKAEDVLGLD